MNLQKFLKIPRVSIYLTTFEPKVADNFLFLLSISMSENQLAFFFNQAIISTFFHCAKGFKKEKNLVFVYNDFHVICRNGYHDSFCPMFPGSNSSKKNSAEKCYNWGPLRFNFSVGSMLMGTPFACNS